MANTPRFWRRFLSRTLTSFAAPLLLPLAGSAAEPIPLPVEPAPQVAPLPAAPLTLAECIHIALERQPALAAQRINLANTQATLEALEKHRLAGVISRAFPIRKQQAALGITIATAGANQAEWETIYAVTRNYLTVVYARQQERVARDLIESLNATYIAAQAALKAGARNASEEDLDRVTAVKLLAQSRLVDAQVGVERALAALREAMGLEAGCPLRIPLGGLPAPRFDFTKEQVIDLALTRRGELVQVATLAQVFALEIDAQAASCKLTTQTFAALADIHARPIPQEVHNTEYRPGAIGPEMPVFLAGTKQERMDRASAFRDRAEVVVKKTRNLIVLEAENGYYKWRQEADKISLSRDAAARTAKLAQAMRNNYTSGQRGTVRDVLEALLIDAVSQAAYNQNLYQHLLALADIQRITAGGLVLDLRLAPAATKNNQPAK